MFTGIHRENLSELRAFSLPQVRLRVSHVIIDVAEDCFLVFLFQAAPEFSWGAHPKGIRFYVRFLGDQGTGGGDRTGSDDGAVEFDGRHPLYPSSFACAARHDDLSPTGHRG